MRKNLKTLALFLICCLIAGVFGGCASTPSTTSPASTTSSTTKTVSSSSSTVSKVVNGINTTGLPIAAESITLNVLVVRNANDQTKSYAVKPFVLRSIKDTGLKFKFTELVTDVNAQMSVILASNDRPDIFLGGLTDEALVEKNKSLFAELQVLIPTYTPSVKAYYDKNNVDWSVIKDSNGKIYQLLTGMYVSEQNSAGNLPWINQTWLDKLGLKKPTNTDELYTVLKTFKEKDPNGDGNPKNEIPLDFCEKGENIGTWGASWGVAGQGGNIWYLVKSGKVTGTVNIAAYRKYLEYFHKLYAEGLINPEGFSQTADQFNASIKAMNVGAYYAWSPQNKLGATKESEQYTFLGNVKASGFENEYAFAGGNTVSITKGFTMSATCKYKEAALRWWDYLSSTDELRWMTARGPEGINWKYGDDGVTHFVAATTNDQRQALIVKYGMEKDFDGSMVGASFYMDSWFPLIDKNTSYAAPKEGEIVTQGYLRQQAIRGELKSVLTQPMANNSVPAALTDEYTFKCEGLDDYIKAFRAEAIIKGVTDESWNKYLNELEKRNYKFYLDYFQKKLDGKFN